MYKNQQSLTLELVPTHLDLILSDSVMFSLPVVTVEAEGFCFWWRNSGEHAHLDDDLAWYHWRYRSDWAVDSGQSRNSEIAFQLSLGPGTRSLDLLSTSTTEESTKRFATSCVFVDKLFQCSITVIYFDLFFLDNQITCDKAARYLAAVCTVAEMTTSLLAKELIVCDGHGDTSTKARSGE